MKRNMNKDLLIDNCCFVYIAISIDATILFFTISRNVYFVWHKYCSKSYRYKYPLTPNHFRFFKTRFEEKCLAIKSISFLHNKVLSSFFDVIWFLDITKCQPRLTLFDSWVEWCVLLHKLMLVETKMPFTEIYISM